MIEEYSQDQRIYFQIKKARQVPGTNFSIFKQKLKTKKFCKLPKRKKVGYTWRSGIRIISEFSKARLEARRYFWRKFIFVLELHICMLIKCEGTWRHFRLDRSRNFFFFTFRAFSLRNLLQNMPHQREGMKKREYMG